MIPKSRRNADLVRLGQFADLDVTAPEVPEDLTALADADIGTLHDELTRYYTAAREAAATVEAVQALDAVVDRILALRSEAERRISGPEQAQAALAAHDARLAVAEPAPAEPAAEPPAGEHAAAPEATPAPAPAAPAAPAPAPVVAAVTHEPAPAVPPLPTDASTEPITAAATPLRPGMVITAAGEIPGYTSGEHMADLDAIAEAIYKKREAIGRPGPNVGSDLITVASVHAEYPDDRHLKKDDSLRVQRDKVNEVTSLEAITASGGLCAPVQPYYDIMTIAEAVRPVRDALATFQADRGGIRLIPPPQLVDAAGAIGFVTAAVDAAALGGNGGQIAAATKPCLHVTCPGVVEYDIAAVTRCLEFGNITSRAYPEQVAAWTALALAQHARKAETALLDVIASKSTQVTLAKVVGAARDVIAGIVKAAAYYRNHNRMGAMRPLRCLLPAWVIDLMIADLTHGSGFEMEFFAMARQQIADALGEVGVNVSFYLDSGTGKGQLFNSGAVQTAGALTTFPTTVVWYLFAEGSFLWLDGGTIDFGVVRDSTLNSLNNYRIFAETLETAAFVGVESIEGTQTVVADGTAAGVAYGLGAATALPASY